MAQSSVEGNFAVGSGTQLVSAYTSSLETTGGSTVLSLGCHPNDASQAHVTTNAVFSPCFKEVNEKSAGSTMTVRCPLARSELGGNILGCPVRAWVQIFCQWEPLF